MRLVRIAAVLLILAAPLVAGMGLDESQGPTSIPEPQADYRVRLVDQEGTRVELSHFAVAGQTFLLGKQGQGEVAIPLDKLTSAKISQAGGKLSAALTFSGASPVTITVDPKLELTGRTDYGNYRIAVGEVRSIEVLGIAGGEQASNSN